MLVNPEYNETPYIDMATVEVKQKGCSLKDYLQGISPKFITMSLIAAANGTLYGLTIPEAGGENLENFLGIQDGPVAKGVVYALSAGAGLCYTMFYYKTIESLNLKPNSFTQVMFSLFAPFAATCYLTGGVEGADLLGFLSSEAAIGIGVTLFIFRMVSCFDASMKFPDRFTEMEESWSKAWSERDYKELTRLVITGLSSIGYSISTTDSIYAAIRIILGWFNVGSKAASIASYVGSGLGALGILPLTLYWTHRGLKQLTFGGKINSQGNNPDPTDIYTYIGLLLVLPNILGVVGASVSVTGRVFGTFGTFAEIVRLTTSIIYAASSGTPGLSTFVRSIVSRNTATAPLPATDSVDQGHLLSSEARKGWDCFGFLSSTKPKNNVGEPPVNALATAPII